VHGLPIDVDREDRRYRCLLKPPLPCQACHGYMVANAQHLEVEIGADGSTSTHPSEATATAPPAGASSLMEIMVICFSNLRDED
jgi:hypothetical protein